jgi:uncharacterized protein YutE (UPF0331/DUF86 family)
MMVSRHVIAARLERLAENLQLLRKVQEIDVATFCADPFLYGAAERNLQLAIETLLDIGNHIISDRGYRKPETYADILAILVEQQVIDHDLFSRLDGMASFRNLLVHDYLRLDRRKVYQVVQQQLAALEDLSRVFVRLI